MRLSATSGAYSPAKSAELTLFGHPPVVRTSLSSAFRSSHERVPDGLPPSRYSAIAVAEVSERSLMKRSVPFNQRTIKSKILQCTGSPQGCSITTVPFSSMARVWKTCWGLWNKVAADTGLKPSPARRDIHPIGVLGTTSTPRGPPSSAPPKGSGRST